MNVDCCVQECRLHRSMSRHTFPENHKRFLLWKQTVFSEKIASLCDTELHKRFVCYKHFKEEDYTVASKYRWLKNNVLPSIALLYNQDNTGVRISDINVEVSENVKPSCGFEVQGGSTGNDTRSVARNILQWKYRYQEIYPVRCKSNAKRHCSRRGNSNAGEVLFELSILLRTATNYNIRIEEGNVTCFESSPTSQACQHIDPQLLHTIVFF